MDSVYTSLWLLSKIQDLVMLCAFRNWYNHETVNDPASYIFKCDNVMSTTYSYYLYDLNVAVSLIFIW